jgi:hypothetical protein
MTITEAFGTVADNLAQAAPEKIIGLKAPASMSVRVEELVFRRKDDLITTEESAELERFLALDLFINLSKARARLLLQSA